METEEFFGLIREANGKVPGFHKLGSGLSDKEYAVWRSRNPNRLLPEDYLQFLRLHNGVIINTKYKSSGYQQILPLDRVQYAPGIIYLDIHTSDGDFPESVIALTDDGDGAWHLVYDTANGKYYEVSPIDGFQYPIEVGDTWSSALSWLISKGSIMPKDD